MKELQAFALKRAEWLAGAYDIDESARSAFIHDVATELVACANAFIDAVDKVEKENRGLVGESVNRHARRGIAKALRRRSK